MALTNVIGTGGYTVVNIHEYYKSRRHIGLEVITYTDSTKLMEINRFGMTVNTYDTVESVIDRDLTSPPVSPTEGDKYIVGNSASGDWSGLDKKVVCWNGSSWDELVRDSVVVEDEDILLEWNGTAWVKNEYKISESDWDTNFGISAISADGENIIKKSYAFIKSIPQFAGVVDV
jgi:hypothetical protein